MELEIFFEKSQKTEKISFSGKTVHDLLDQLNINPETVLVIRASEVITEDERLANNNKLEILSVISGG